MLRRCGETFVASLVKRPCVSCRCFLVPEDHRTLSRSEYALLPLASVYSPASSSSSRPRFFCDGPSSPVSPSAASQVRLDRRMERKLEEFTQLLQEPEQTRIDGPDVRRKFGLSSSDLDELGHRYIEKESPYEATRQLPIRQFLLPDIVDLAMRKIGREQVLAHYKRYLRKSSQSKVYGAEESEPEEQGSQATALRSSKPRWYSAPSTTTVEGRESVKQGLISNVAICGIKGSVWLYTGSHAVFADLMHSAADVANYSYRFSQLSRTIQSRDMLHPYGYAPLRYITADRSFVILGGLGCIVPFCLGSSELWRHLSSGAGCIAFAPGLQAVLLPTAVFMASIALEGLALRTAYHEIMELAIRSGIGDEHSQDWRRCYAYIQEGSDTMSIATFCEAGSGVLGSSVGLAGLGLSWYYLDGVYDVCSSLLMAGVVGAVSAFLLRRSGSALLGRTLPFKRVEGLVSLLEERATILNIYDVKTEVIGTDTVRFKAEVQFNPQAITKRLLRDSDRGVATSDQLVGTTHGAKLGAEFQELYPQLRQGLSTSHASEAWLFANNALFYEALAWELKKAERVLRLELKEFRNVHIDLEPW